jgi:hypothetical protein
VSRFGGLAPSSGIGRLMKWLLAIASAGAVFAACTGNSG